MNLDTIGKRLKFLRKEAKLTQTDVANYVGLKSKAAIHKWENDLSHPNHKQVSDLIMLFGSTLDYIVMGVGPAHDLYKKPAHKNESGNLYANESFGSYNNLQTKDLEVELIKKQNTIDKQNEIIESLKDTINSLNKTLQLLNKS